MSNRYYEQYQNCLTESVNQTEQFTTEELEIAELCLEALSSLDDYTMLKFENYLLTDRFTEAGVILEASINEGGFEDLVKNYLNKTDTKKAIGRDVKRGVSDFFKKPSTTTKVKRAVGDEIEDTVGSIKRLFTKKPENKDSLFISKQTKDDWDKLQKAKDFRQVGKVAAIAAGAGLAAWGAYKGGKALYGKLKTAISNWKSGTKDKDPKKLASAAKDMAAVIKQAPPKVASTLGTKIVAPAVSQKVKAKGGSASKPAASDKSKSDTGSKSRSASASKSSGTGNPDNWGGKRPGAGRPEGS